MPTPSAQKQNMPPPQGDQVQAEKYLSKLIELISADKLTVTHTDLSAFDPSSLEDHYKLDLKDYQVEVSHSKNPNTSEDSFVLIFTNIKNIQSGTCEKVILAFTYLTATQYSKFKAVADAQLEKRRLEEQKQKFQEAMTGIDSALAELNSQSNLPETPMPVTEVAQSKINSIPEGTTLSQLGNSPVAQT